MGVDVRAHANAGEPPESGKPSGTTSRTRTAALNLLAKEETSKKRIQEVKTEPRAKGKWVLHEAVVDSGAEESVMHPRTFPGMVQESVMSKAGAAYRAANNTRIPNLGQKDVLFVTDEGHQCGMPLQCAEVERTLLAVTQLAEGNNDVVLRKKGGAIINRVTKKSIKLIRRGGTYILRMWVWMPPDQAANAVQSDGDPGAAPGFTRQVETV